MDKLVTMSMASPDVLSIVDAQAMADDTGNSLSGEQRRYLRSFADSMQKQDDAWSLDRTKNAIIKGEDGFRGIQDYRSLVNTALSDGDTEVARAYAADLKAFSEGHTNKAKALSQAMKEFQATGKPIQVVRGLRQGSWFISPEKLSGKEMADNQGLVVNVKSKNLVQAARTEAKALIAASQEMDNLMELAQSSTSMKQLEVASTSEETVLDKSPETQTDESAQEAATQAEPAPAEPAQEPLDNRPVEAEPTSDPELRDDADIRTDATSTDARTGEDTGNGIDVTKQKSSDVRVCDLRRLLREWKVLQAANNQVNDIYEKAKKDPSMETEALENASDQVAENLIAYSNEFDDRIEVMESHPSPAVQEAIEAFKLDATYTSGELDIGTVVNFLTDIGKKASKYDTTMPDTSNTQSEAEPALVSEEAVEPAIESGLLAAIRDKADQVQGGLATNKFRTANLISAYFNQTSGRDGNTILRPLAKVKNFLSTLISDDSLLSQFVEDDRAVLSGRATVRDTMMAHFQETVTQWNMALDSLYKVQTRVDVKYRNLVHFLVDEQGNLPENVKTAIIYAAWTYVAENANDSWMNLPEKINAILGKPPSKPVASDATALLSNKGTRANVVINSLGERAVKALGLKAHSDAPVNVQAQLESAMGAYAEALLMDQGLVERPVVTSDLLNRNGGTQQLGHPFIRLARDWASTKKDPVDAAKVIGEKVRNTQGYLDKIFGVEPGLKEPSFEPEDFTQEKTKGTSQNIPGRMAEIQDVQAKRAWKVRAWINGLWQSLDSDIQDDIVGVEDLTTAHVSQRLSIQGRNDGLVCEREQWGAFVAFVKMLGEDSLNALDQAFYFMPNLWINQCAGLLSNTVNPQSSKIHRHLMGMDNWKGTVSTAKNSKVNKLFRANVALGLGIKADKKPMDGLKGSLAELDQKIKGPLYQAALAAIKRQQGGEYFLPADQENIAAAVKDAKQKMQSLDALHAYARMEVAKDALEKNFDPDMVMMEVDGVTNGPMLTLLLLGAANSTHGLFTFLNKGGFYKQGSDHKNYVAYKSAEGSEDLYETTAKAMDDELKSILLTRKSLAPVATAIQFMKGEFLNEDTGKVTDAGRNLIKTPLTGMMFGQEVKNGVGSMFNEFVDDTYRKVSGIARSSDTNAQKQADVGVWAGHVNVMIGDKALSIPTDITLDAALELEFTKAQLKMIRKGFDATVGAAIESTMDSLFGVFFERLKVMSQGAQVSAQLYTVMFEHLVEQKVESLIKQGQLAARGLKPNNRGEVNPQPLQDLSPTQIAEIKEQLKALKPVTHSAMSQAEDDLDAGLFLPKESRKLSDDINYSQEMALGKLIPANTPDGNNISSIKTKGYKSVLEDPGVRTLVLMIHSADSAISAYAYEQLSALNVHDANGLSIADVANGARNLNEATYKVMLAFSVPLEIKDTLERTVTGLHEFASMIEKSPALQKRFKQLESDYVERLDEIENSLFSASGLDWVSQVLGQLTKAAYAAEITKLDAMSQMGFVDQYALEGGEFEVTDVLRREALDKLEQARTEAAGPNAAELLVLSQRIYAAIESNPETTKT